MKPERNRATTGTKLSGLGKQPRSIFGHCMVTPRSLQGHYVRFSAARSNLSSFVLVNPVEYKHYKSNGTKKNQKEQRDVRKNQWNGQKQTSIMLCGFMNGLSSSRYSDILVAYAAWLHSGFGFAAFRFSFMNGSSSCLPTLGSFGRMLRGCIPDSVSLRFEFCFMNG